LHEGSRRCGSSARSPTVTAKQHGARDLLWSFANRHVLPVLGACRMRELRQRCGGADSSQVKLERARAPNPGGPRRPVIQNDPWTSAGAPRRTLRNGSDQQVVLVTAQGDPLWTGRPPQAYITTPTPSIASIRRRSAAPQLMTSSRPTSSSRWIEGAGDLTGRAGATDNRRRFEVARKLRDEEPAQLESDRSDDSAHRRVDCDLTAHQRAKPIAERIGGRGPNRGRRALVATLRLRRDWRVSESPASRVSRPTSTSPTARIRVSGPHKSRRRQSATRDDIPTGFVGELRAYLSTPRAATRPDAPAVPERRTGKRRDKEHTSCNRVLAPQLPRRANELRDGSRPTADRRARHDGWPPRPTPAPAHVHSSIMLQLPAPRSPYVQDQVGPADPALTPEDLRACPQAPQPAPVRRCVRRALGRGDSVHCSTPTCTPTGRSEGGVNAGRSRPTPG
jgi:hypothetical protein